jgi:hypothetical protein
MCRELYRRQGAPPTGFPSPELLGGERCWIENDLEFARQLVQGCSPSTVTVCTRIPDELDVGYIQRQMELMEVHCSVVYAQQRYTTMHCMRNAGIIDSSRKCNVM